MSKNQFTGIAMQPQRNRKFCQFNNDQNCIDVGYMGLVNRAQHLSWSL